MTAKDLIARLESFTHFRGQDIDMPVYIETWADVEYVDIVGSEMHLPLTDGGGMYIVLTAGYKGEAEE